MSASLGTYHPAPHRNRVSMAWLFFGVLAAPVMWMAHLLLSYFASSEACFPGHAPLFLSSADRQALRIALAVFDLIALVIAVFGGFISWRSWIKSREEARGSSTHAIEAGEGRTRFLALWGMLSSSLFLAALVFATIASFMVPICAR